MVLGWLHTSDVITEEDVILNCRATGMNTVPRFSIKNEPRFDKKHYGLYRFYNDDGRLLYVGVSVNIYGRMKSYICDKSTSEYPITSERTGERISKILITVLGTYEKGMNLNTICFRKAITEVESYYIHLLQPPLNVRKPTKDFAIQYSRSKALDGLNRMEELIRKEELEYELRQKDES